MSTEEIAPEEIQTRQSEDETIATRDANTPGNAHENDSGDAVAGQPKPESAAGMVLTPEQQRERAAQLAEITNPGSALYHVYLAHYFGTSPNVIAHCPDRFESHFVMQRYQDALQKEQTGEPMTPYQSRILGKPAQNAATGNPDAPNGEPSSMGDEVKDNVANVTTDGDAATQDKKPDNKAGSAQDSGKPSYAIWNTDNTLPHGAPVAAGPMADQRVQNSNEPAGNEARPGLTIDEFNQYARLAKAQEHRPKQVGGNKQQEANPAEQKQILDMQQRLGVKQTGRYDNATRHALQGAFIDLIRPAAEADEKKSGVPAAVTIAQAIIESGYGVGIPTDIRTGQRSNNFFGIKPDQAGQAFVTDWTKEYNTKTGKKEPKLQPFAVYDDFGGSVEEHSAFLKRNARYNSLFSTSDPEKWADGLQKAGYAGESPDYASSLKNAMHKWKLIK